MSETSIEWTAGDDGTKGRSWNPIRGCSAVSPGCDNCYAEKIAERFCGPGQPFQGYATREAGWTGLVSLVGNHLADPLGWRKPSRVFTNSMSDLFHPGFTNEEIAAVFGVMAAAERHTFIVLTKRATRLSKWFRWVDEAAKAAGVRPAEFCRTRAYAVLRTLGDVRSAAACVRADGIWPLPNVWLGVSVENLATLPRVEELCAVPAEVRVVSVEPLLERISLGLFGTLPADRFPNYTMVHQKIGWVIIGGESDSAARPFALDWARELVDECRGAGVPCFVKQLGSRPFGPMDSHVWVQRPGVPGIDTFDIEHELVPSGGGRHVAQIWERRGSCTWHTWDANGIGGENAEDPTIAVAKSEVLKALERQFFHPRDGDWSNLGYRLPGDHPKCNDPARWPEDLRVRQFPEVRPCP